MNILRGSAQPKKSESLNQVFSQSLTENFFFNSFTSLLVVWCLHGLQSTKIKIYSQSVSQLLIVTHFVRDFTGLEFVDWLIGWFFSAPLLDNCLWDVLLEIDANEHLSKSSVHLCVLSEFTDGKCLFCCEEDKCPINFVWLDICPVGTPMDVHPCWLWGRSRENAWL